MSFPVECTLKYDKDDPSTHVVTTHISQVGTVTFDPRKDGRRIYEFATRDMQEECLKKGR